MNKEQLLAVCLTFGVLTEGLKTNAQLQEALDANTGYQEYLKALAGKEAAERAASASANELTIANGALAEAGNKVAELAGDLSTANQELATKQAELDQANETITALNGDLENKDAKILALKNDLATFTLAPMPENLKKEEPAEKPTFEYLGRKFAFTAKAPKKLCVDGVVRTQEELITDTEAMTSLIVGENGFVKQVF